MTIQSSFYRAATLGIHVSRSRCSGLGVVCLLFSVLLLASVSGALAQDITYNIVDYPANEADQYSGTDSIAGTIITDGTIGPLSASDIIGGTFSFTGSYGTLSGPASFGTPVGLDATPSQLLLDAGAESSFSIGTTQALSTISLMSGWVAYDNYTGGGQYDGGIQDEFETLTALVAYFDSEPVPAYPGSIGASSSWVIATVPEPGSLALLFCAVFTFGVVYLRRCWGRSVDESREAFGAFLESVFRTLPGRHRVGTGVRPALCTLPRQSA